MISHYKNRCVKCGSNATIAHHLNYKKWGTELVSDGIAVCKHCHYHVYHADIYLDNELSQILSAQV